MPLAAPATAADYASKISGVEAKYRAIEEAATHRDILLWAPIERDPHIMISSPLKCRDWTARSSLISRTETMPIMMSFGPK
jgi:hypothetical protein